ncbi:MAG: alcohol dehydrogenase [Paenibacillaceae bacterium]|nr:alcohol dehydrogenase [Paenibacillaceae bacterium]
MDLFSKLSLFRLPQTILTGPGTIAQLGREARLCGADKVLVVTDKVIRQTGLLEEVTDPLNESGIAFEILDGVTAEPPFELMERLAAEVSGYGHQLVVGIGGGSVLDSAKLLAVMAGNPGADLRSWVGTDKIERPGLPLILAPTTAGTGSEVTNIAVLTDHSDHVKKGIASRHLLASTAIVDSQLTRTMPPSVAAATGMDALVHAIESYTSLRASELTDGIALQAIKLISRSLRQAVLGGNNTAAREDMAMGSLLAGISMGNAGAGAVHALAYPLGGKFKVAHGVANSLLLSYVLRYNAVANLPKFAEVAKAMGEPVEGLSLRDAAFSAIEAAARLAADVGIPAGIADVGVGQADIPALAEEASKIDRLLNNNPRRLTLRDIEQIYRDAYAGRGASGS